MNLRARKEKYTVIESVRGQFPDGLYEAIKFQRRQVRYKDTKNSMFFYQQNWNSLGLGITNDYWLIG